MSTALAMEDIGKFGLGLTSLLVDYTHACIRNMVSAANDATSYRCVSRSLITFEASRTGGLNEAQLHAVANSFMRVRQLSAAQQSGLHILNQSTMEEMALEGTDIVRLVSSLAMETTEMGLPAHIPCRLVQGPSLLWAGDQVTRQNRLSPQRHWPPCELHHFKNSPGIPSEPQEQPFRRSQSTCMISWHVGRVSLQYVFAVASTAMVPGRLAGHG
jgi:hypothetical protein